MGNPIGFKQHNREAPHGRPIPARISDWNEVYDLAGFGTEKLRTQGSRCMDCGIPFCASGCPLGNIIPEWNDLVYKDRWRSAVEMLLKTNNFPEFTGRICPAPCEEACVLGIGEKPVTIRFIEEAIIERAFEEGWIAASPPLHRTGKRVAIIGSGPAGLACADQLNKAGHAVTVYERADRIGGLLTYGIPNFKLEKRIVERRVALMREEGVEFVVDANVGFNVKIEDLRREYDVICLTGGATKARDLDLPGRSLGGIHLAMEYLPQQNRSNFGDSVPGQITAAGKNVIILGGGDTGADCLGTAIRQGAKSITQLELMPKPPEARTEEMPWPRWPMILRTSSAHEEGGIRDWSVITKEFIGDNGSLRKLRASRLEWVKEDGKFVSKEIAGSEFELDCELCLLALGFVSPEHEGPVAQLGLALDARGNVKTDQNYQSSVPGVFAAGDMRRGQSLVVWAIAEGRQAARAIDASLMGRSDL